MSDPRLSWLFHSSPLSPLLTRQGLTPSAGESAYSNHPAIEAWLTRASERRLLAIHTKKGEKGVIHFTNDITGLVAHQDTIDEEFHLIQSKEATAHFATPDEFGRSVIITNTVGDAVEGLYQIIHTVFAPKLLG